MVINKLRHFLIERLDLASVKLRIVNVRRHDVAHFTRLVSLEWKSWKSLNKIKKRYFFKKSFIETSRMREK